MSGCPCWVADRGKKWAKAGKVQRAGVSGLTRVDNFITLVIKTAYIYLFIYCLDIIFCPFVDVSVVS